MQLSRISNYALRFSYAQNSSVRGSQDKLVGPSAVLLAALGITLSGFSVKQMLNNTNVRRM